VSRSRHILENVMPAFSKHRRSVADCLAAQGGESHVFSKKNGRRPIQENASFAIGTIVLAGH
jgi:hypothetical protein